MKRVVSISLGSSRRDHEVELELLGQTIQIRRIGVDGDFKRARRTFLELDGHVDAFGIGGCELGINFADRYYRLRSVTPLVAGLKTPVVDGSGIRGVVERRMGSFVMEHLGDYLESLPGGRRVLFCVSAGRYDMVESFHDEGFFMKFGDPGFVLGWPITSHRLWLAKLAGRIVIPLVVQAPFAWLYPTGKKQDINRPRFTRWFEWANVIADDFLYIRRHLPICVQGKIVVTNTTTPADQEMLRERGVKYLVTSTPLLAGRSFGTNVMEAAFVAASGSSQVLHPNELAPLIAAAGYQPQITRLN